MVVISRSLAEQDFGQEDPLGQQIDLPDLAKAPAHLASTRFGIIGVVKDVRNQGPSEVPWPGVYLPTTLTAAGIVIGLAASQMTNRLVVSYVMMQSADDDVLWSGVGAVAVIALVGLAACLIPARRVSRMSPMAALRQD